MFRQVLAGLLLLSLSTLLSNAVVEAQSSERPSIPNVYLDCQRCDFNYIRTNIEFVNYVRDQDDADVYLRITDSRTAGGREYTLHFRGIEPFSDRSDTLTYRTRDTDSSDEERAGLVRYIKVGLVPFASRTNAIENLNVFYDPPEVLDEPEIEDPWNNWVFDVNMRSNISGEESELNIGLYTGLSAERITHRWKIRTRARAELRRRNLELTDRTLKINRDWGEYWGMAAYSINDHFSVGLFSRVNFSRTGNIALNAELAPAIEYNFFPYGEYQERRFLISYSITPAHRRYYETTVFLQDTENIIQQELSTRLRFDQPWGRIDIRVSGSNFFHSRDIYRINFNPSFDIRVVRGLSVSISGRYRIINDQLAIPLPDDVDPDDPISIIEGTERPTSYDYRISFGFSYTFGSRYSNVVNPRF